MSNRATIHTSYRVGNGYLSLVVGSMFSGKTKRLMETHRRIGAEFPLKTQLVINFEGDTRYNESTLLTTHDGHTLPCVSATTLGSLLLEMMRVDVILINEAQFFQDLVDQVLELVNELGKEVYVFGLDGDFRHQRFGGILDLIPECDSVVKLRAICNQCSTPDCAIFSQRLTGESQQVVIGSDNYMPICRKCHLMQKVVNE
jgi:thymidine kinase